MQARIWSLAAIALAISLLGTGSAQAATKANLYRYYSASNTDHSYSRTATPPSGYVYENVEGQIWSASYSGAVALYEYYNATNKDSYYTRTRNDAGLAAFGYAYKRVVGYVYAASASGRVPLYQYWNATVGDHGYTTTRDDAAWALFGYSYETIAAYIFPKATCGDGVCNAATETCSNCKADCGSNLSCPTAGSSYILYLHGRGQASWPDFGAVTHKAGWQHIFFTYNGDLRLNDAAIVNQLKSAFKTYCGTGKTCMVLCYSAGCLRTLHTLSQLTSSQVPGLLRIEAAASAAGGSELAETRLKSQLKKIAKWVATVVFVVKVALVAVTFTPLVAGYIGTIQTAVSTATGIPASVIAGAASGWTVISGANTLYNFVSGNTTNAYLSTVISAATGTNALLREQPIDQDLTTSAARSTWSSIQNKAYAPMYHYAGRRDICVKKKVLFKTFKICGNKDLPGKRGDGVVGMHSSCGFAAKGSYYDCCAAGSKYTNRKIGTSLVVSGTGYTTSAACSWDADHTMMPIIGIMGAGLSLATIITQSTPISPNLASYVECNLLYDECDMADEGYGNAYSRLPGTKNMTILAQAMSMGGDTCQTCDKDGFTTCENFSTAMTGATYVAPRDLGIYDWCSTCKDPNGNSSHCCYVGAYGWTNVKQPGQRPVGRKKTTSVVKIGNEYVEPCKSYDKYGTCIDIPCVSYDKYGNCKHLRNKHSCDTQSMQGWGCLKYDKFGACSLYGKLNP